MSDSTLWITRCPVPTASSIAFDRGLLEADLRDFEIEVNSLQDQPDAELRDAHFHHGLTGLIREGGNVPALWARSAGADTRLVALTWVDEYQAILTLDPALDEPAKLAGKRLGVPRHRGSVIDFWAAMALRGFDAALGLAGLSLDDAELVDLETDRNETGWGPGARAPRGTWDLELEGLRDGTVDAVYVKGAPGVAAARPAEVHEVVEFGSHPDPSVRVNNGTPRTITVAAELLEVEGLVARFLATLLTAADWASANGDDLARVLAAETGGDVEGVRDAYGAARLHPDLRDDWLDALDQERRFLLGQGLQDSDFEIASWVDPGPIAEARELIASARSAA
jgi:ABC-type nitrate/sulfonate/bicarbonate transport system substrate-binding protein